MKFKIESGNQVKLGFILATPTNLILFGPKGFNSKPPILISMLTSLGFSIFLAS